MAPSGWYPDPSGEPNRFRYWDGSAWSDETTADPNSPAPGTAQPGPGQAPAGSSPYGQGTTPPVYGQGSYEGTGPGRVAPATPSPTHAEYGRPTWLIPLIAVVAVLVIIGGVAIALLLTNGGTDDGEAAADGRNTSSTGPSGQSSEDGSPEATPSGPESSRPPSADFVNCTSGQPQARESKPVEGSITGGGLTASIPEGYTHERRLIGAFAFARDVDAAVRPIEEFWISTLVVGRVERTSGFTSTEQAAHEIMRCMSAAETLYSGFTGMTDVHDKATKVDGKDAWTYRTEIRVETPEVEAEGDLAEVTVVDTGDPDGFAVFIGVTPIGDDSLAQVLDTVAEGLQVD